MSSEICACKRGVDVFYSGVFTCRTRDILRELHKRARDGVRSGGDNIGGNDGDGIHGSRGPKWTIGNLEKKNEVRKEIRRNPQNDGSGGDKGRE